MAETVGGGNAEEARGLIGRGLRSTGLLHGLLPRCARRVADADGTVASGTRLARRLERLMVRVPELDVVTDAPLLVSSVLGALRRLENTLHFKRR